MVMNARRSAQIVCGLSAALAFFAGCRDILGIEEKTFDSSLAGSGGGGAGGTGGSAPALSCESYCNLLQETCVGNNLQFSSIDACIGLCSTFPVGTLDDKSGHTLGCRIHVLETSKAMIESSDCAAAGPGGNGVCGSNCESYCISMQTVCPASYESGELCHDACQPLIECGDYYVDPNITPDNPSVQCRLYHLSAAAINLLGATPGEQTDSQIKHCPHADGTTECIAVADPMCPM
jgi:hypothetical protein